MFKKYFLSRALAAPFKRIGTIWAILVGGIMRNNSVKLFEFGPVVQEMLFKEKVYGQTKTNHNISP